MRLFRFLRPKSSAPVARERLQILLEYERNLVSQTDLIAVLREEILAVVGRHVTIDKVQIRVDRGAELSTLAVDIQTGRTVAEPFFRRARACVEVGCKGLTAGASDCDWQRNEHSRSRQFFISWQLCPKMQNSACRQPLG